MLPLAISNHIKASSSNASGWDTAICRSPNYVSGRLNPTSLENAIAAKNRAPQAENYRQASVLERVPQRFTCMPSARAK